MKILYHHRTGSKDGQAVHIEELIGALRRRGHDVIVVAPATTERQEFGQQSGLVSALKRHLPKAIYEAAEFSYAFVAYGRLRAAYLEHRPDVLYERSNLFQPAGLWLKRRYGLPMLLEVNAPLFAERSEFGGLALKGLARWSERAVWRHADHVLPVTQALADYVRQAGVPEERISVIPNAINPDRFSRSIDAAAAKARLDLSGKLVLGFTGFVREWHGLDRVIELLAERGAPAGLHLLVVGDGPGRETLEAQARGLGVADRLTFTGPVGRDAVADHVAAFDIALQPAVRPYASPLKLFEYMTLARPIVAPDTPNIREVLSDRESALLFDPASGEAFRRTVELLCRDAGLRQRLGAGAAQAIVDRGLTWNRNAERIEALMARLASSRADPAYAAAIA